MANLPPQIDAKDMSEADADAMLQIVPNIASYLASCTSKDGKDSTVVITVMSETGTRKWAMRLVIPGKLLAKYEHITGETIPRASTVLDMSTLSPPIEDGEVLLTSKVAAEQ